MQHDYNQEALELHKTHKGKIETGLKVPLTNKDELSRVYARCSGSVSCDWER